MGGCRCTYKNCSLKSDGVTHMFHYPVFDKVRCHQWLTNAQKLEFLNLKVSQLKNRVVCQHHFTYDNFMNFLKDKLTFDAVPTLDGPYCDTSQLTESKTEQEVSKLYTISLDDIENEYLTFNDKKANFSVKYGDFLTNCDLMDLDSMTVTNDNTQITMKDEHYKEQNNVIINNNLPPQKESHINLFLNSGHDAFNSNHNNIITVQVTELPLEYNAAEKQNLDMPNLNVSHAEVPQTNKDTHNAMQQTHNSTEQSAKKSGRLRNKIIILDEKKIDSSIEVTKPIPVKLEPICPSADISLTHKSKKINSSLQHNIKKDNFLTLPDLSEKINMESEIVNIETNSTQPVIVPDNIEKNQSAVIKEISVENTTLNKDKENTFSMHNSESNIVNRDKCNKNTKSLLKKKIPPERMVAIEEKRKFNMKLRDIIASCLDKLDDEESNDYNSRKVKKKLKHNITQKVSDYLSKDPELPSVQDYTIAYLEARMKKMEDVLLNKIDQNSRKIMDLQKTLTLPVDKKVAHTQTVVSEELQKKHLYQEISKFLSPQANSLLYEELFINKYAQKNQVCSPAKKRKYR